MPNNAQSIIQPGLETLKGFVTAIRTLTIFPIPGKDADNISSALPWFPLVGILQGCFLFGVCSISNVVFGAKLYEITALIVLASGIIVSRGFHLDGLADWGDAFWGAYDKKRTLEIMKDTHIGTFGTLTLITVLLAKWIAFKLLIAKSAAIWIICAYLISRSVQVDLMVRLPYARQEGGTGGPFIQGASAKHYTIVLLVTLCSLLLVYGLIGMALFGVGIIVSLIFGSWCRKRIGGATGDILGACSEVTETVILLLSVAIS